MGKGSFFSSPAVKPVHIFRISGYKWAKKAEFNGFSTPHIAPVKLAQSGLMEKNGPIGKEPEGT